MNQESKLALKGKLRGILPPVTMPFDAKGKLVASGIKKQIDFMIESGVNAIVAGGSTGEGHTLSTEEFVESMEATHEAIAGLVPFVVGLIVNSTIEAIERTKKIAHLKPEALQVTPVHYLFKPGADATVRHFREIYDETGVPILIYNVIPWNYLSADLMLKIMDEVPGVVGMKQSSGDLKSLSDLIGSAKKDNIVLTGIDALLYPGFALGADGAISALTSAVPKQTVELYNAVKRGDHEKARELHWKLNGLWNVVRHDNLPACTKYIQSRQGVDFFLPRAPMETVSDDQKKVIDGALRAMGI
ncbi:MULTISPECIES: dihydrodipicolinate synthase family protein [unclassified Rhizobium]|uniref:dihydrodipicolinate synthase family protein n=1 Tax=unclassified Rhizobium TaxID=2613769 RepID=UPI001ADAEBD6|nr:MULTISPECIES: dihydrodipicolinate synthase family protein [unclassified Rhizobium]MBO9128077.1 dihydrodipicolinate synthase family protein [Rhizobium sp. 16-488-2b]MBO9178098.1 dihydrodipicolinate synthase family protein [Rhizobium sp. 16-488-2a]